MVGENMERRIALPTCPEDGWVEFRDLDELTGEDMHVIRAHISQADSGGQTTNRVMREAMRLLVLTWNVPYLADPRTPEANEAAWKKLRAKDLRAIEDALSDVWLLMRPPSANAGDAGPGSPTRPDSD